MLTHNNRFLKMALHASNFSQCWQFLAQAKNQEIQSKYSLDPITDPKQKNFEADKST